MLAVLVHKYARLKTDLDTLSLQLLRPFLLHIHLSSGARPACSIGSDLVLSVSYRGVRPVRYCKANRLNEVCRKPSDVIPNCYTAHAMDLSES